MKLSGEVLCNKIGKPVKQSIMEVRDVTGTKRRRRRSNERRERTKDKVTNDKEI